MCAKRRACGFSAGPSTLMRKIGFLLSFCGGVFAFQGFFFLIFGIDHLCAGRAGDQTRHGLGARELCYFGGSMSACVSIRFPITIPPDAVLTGSCIRGYFVTVRFSCPGSMSRDSGHGPMRSGEGLVPRIFDSGLGGG